MSIRAIATVTLAVAAMPLAAQQAPRTLPAPEAEYEEPFSQLGIGSIRELRDGRLVVADPRDKVVSLVDMRRGSATKIGREGSGPQEFGLPMRLYAAPGDTTLLYDAVNSRYLVIGPDGRPVNTFRTEADPVAQAGLGGGPPAGGQVVRPGAAGGGQGAARPGAPGGQGAARPGAPAGQGAARPGGPGPGMMMLGAGLVARASDAQGRLYGEAMGISFDADGRPQQADSAALVRFDRGTRRLDTLAYVKLARGNTQMSGGQGNMRMMIGAANPLTPRDEWTVFPDGRVAIVRGTDYRVDFILPNGTRQAGAPIAYTPVRMNAAEIRYEEGLRNAARANQMSMLVSNNNGQISRSAQMGPGANAPPLEPLTDWPATKPAFRPGLASVLARPNGELWVRRTENAQARGTLYDVINAQGAVAFQVRIPEGLTLVGFGQNTIYTVRKDEDDLVYLQRHAAGEIPLRGN
ncbi:MAG: hypothetical protein KF689_12495 [Gemmatimonadaceae bacterium]|nr:hypothetical protein [Gemmatimonadaceae bacterium]MCW5827199.1 hypothetical protein [Gemmatimonadaceae bacterium]